MKRGSALGFFLSLQRPPDELPDPRQGPCRTCGPRTRGSGGGVRGLAGLGVLDRVKVHAQLGEAFGGDAQLREDGLFKNPDDEAPD